MPRNQKKKPHEAIAALSSLSLLTGLNRRSNGMNLDFCKVLSRAWTLEGMAEGLNKAALALL